MGAHPADRRSGTPARQWVLAVVVGLVGAAAYLPQCRYDFVYDDDFIIGRNPTVCGGPWRHCFTAPYWPRQFGHDPLYRPVTTLSLRLNYAVFGDRAWGYRATNAMLHGVCGALIALLGARFWGRAAAGWVAGLLFAAHPVHAEAVALVVGRAELLAAVFSIVLIHRHLRYLAGDRAPAVRYHLVSASLLLIAIGAKEHAVLVLPGIACLDAWARRRSGGGLRLRQRASRLAASHYVGTVLVVASFFFGRWLMFGGRTTLPADLVNRFANPLIGASTTAALATPPALLFLSVRLFLLPVGLCPIWSVGGFDLPVTLLRADVLTGTVLAAAAVVFAAVGLWRRWRVAVPVALTALFLILPCHFVPAANWLFAERWLYLPSAFAVLLIAGLARSRPALPVVVVAAAVLFAINWQYQRCWRSTDDLMRAVIERQPCNYHGLVGYARQRQMRDELLEAQPQIARLLERFSASPRTWYYQALLGDRLGRPADVVDAVNRFVLLNGPNPLPTALADACARARGALQKERPGKGH